MRIAFSGGMRVSKRIGWLLMLALAGACTQTGSTPPGAEDGEFISHVYGQSSGTDDMFAEGGADSGAAAPSAEPDTADRSTGAAERAIAEADIIQVQGDLLYALSAYTGLTIVDISDPSDLGVVGTYRSSATPFEMYLRDGLLYVMYNGYYTYEVDDAGNWTWQQTARMQALDVSDPSDVVLAGDAEVPGSISDSRMVGDVIYLVTNQNGYCWRCDDNPTTRVASFAVGNFRKIDEVAFEDQQGWGPRSITVTTDRVYVAEGDSWDRRDAATGEITVVDIGDPGGDLFIGDVITTAGPVTSRWQMSEYGGVLRVISQPGGWGSVGIPEVETFTVVSSSEVNPLASLTIALPENETLRSVRFDGVRAYAITQEVVVRSDPLFTFDLSDPAHPVQVGELAIPGWVYHMEPRGDRIYALGYDEDDETWGRGMTVSIFDVSDLANPQMLDRVIFGGDWTNAAEDQDRIHKAFNILLDQNLILVPYSGGEYDEEDCSYEYLSGIQIVDVTGDDLTLRGVAPQIGRARRALMHEGTLFGITDNSVQSFDISDRDAPLSLDNIDVARNISSVHVAGDELVRFGNDWWTDRTVVDTVPLDQAMSSTSNGLDLASTGLENGYSCGESAYWGNAIFPHGDVAYVPRYTNTYGEVDGRWHSTRELTFYVVDMSGETPAIIGAFEVDATRNHYTDVSSYSEHYGEILLTDNALVVGRRSGTYVYDSWGRNSTSTSQYSYDIFSLEDPHNPTFVTRYRMPNDVANRGWGYAPWGCGMDYGWYWYWGGGTNALVSGNIVASSHGVPLEDGSGRVRYYLDRLDLSDPAHPHMLTAVNIPGQPAYFDDARGLVITLEDVLVHEESADDWNECYGTGPRIAYDWEDETCRAWSRNLNSVLIEGNRARLISRHDIDAIHYSQQVAVSDERVFVTRFTDSDTGDYYDRRWDIGSYAIGDTGRLTELPALALPQNGWYNRVQARGTRAFVSQSNELLEIDATDPAAPALETHDMPGWYCSSLQVADETAFCAMGQQGVIAIDL